MLARSMGAFRLIFWGDEKKRIGRTDVEDFALLSLTFWHFFLYL